MGGYLENEWGREESKTKKSASCFFPNKNKPFPLTQHLSGNKSRLQFSMLTGEHLKDGKITAL